MEIVISIVVIAAVLIAVYWQNKREDREIQEKVDRQIAGLHEDNQQKNMENNETKAPQTREFFLETLSQIGCQYEIEEDQRISFQWQGGYFMAEATDDCLFVNVWYLRWGEWLLYDVDTLSRVKRIMNDANINHSLSVVYSVDEENDQFLLHTKRNILFIPEIPDIKNYLQAMLSEFYNVRRYIEKELDKLENQEEKS